MGNAIPHDLLSRQLLDRKSADIASVIESIGPINAQTTKAPSIALWSRMEGFKQQDLDDLLSSYKLVKANLIRGTVHLVTARQYLRWRTVIQPTLKKIVSGFNSGIWDRVDYDSLTSAGDEFLQTALKRGGYTRSEIGEALLPSFPNSSSKELGFAVRLLAPVVQLADENSWVGGRTRYVLARDVLGSSPTEASDPGGLEDLLSTYLMAFGPATAADATYYTGVTGIRAPLERASEEICFGAKAADHLYVRSNSSRGKVPIASVLPEYDNIYFSRRRGVLAEARKRLIPNTATKMHGSILHNGRVVASWIERDGTLELQHWQDSPDREIVEVEFESFSQFWQSP